MHQEFLRDEGILAAVIDISCLLSFLTSWEGMGWRLNNDDPVTGASGNKVTPRPRGREAIVTPRMDTPVGIAEVPPGIAEAREPSPMTSTGEARLAGAAAVFFFGRVEDSVVSLRFVSLFATSAVPEVIRSEILTTAKYKSTVIQNREEGKTKLGTKEYNIVET